MKGACWEKWKEMKIMTPKSHPSLTMVSTKAGAAYTRMHNGCRKFKLGLPEVLFHSGRL
ncbi:hypothetical protein Lalb_Chr11g0065301 [Lupinus albus]|uniref:Uncharacterized protein n=1 Tax=Lupinus albus TaxID=3870 RepID=A0A6A4PQQ1_LUPAL|nr:hypothetical protein Lalb_Chr11g0065301 [Lupinus albus]